MKIFIPPDIDFIREPKKLVSEIDNLFALDFRAKVVEVNNTSILEVE